MVNTAELRQIFPLRGNTLRHVVEGDGRYPRAMTPSAEQFLHRWESTFDRWIPLQRASNVENSFILWRSHGMELIH